MNEQIKAQLMVELAEKCNRLLEEYRADSRFRKLVPNLRLIVAYNPVDRLFAPCLVSDKVPIKDGWQEVAGPFDNAYQALDKAMKLVEEKDK